MTIPTPTHEELQELLGAYALDAVEPDERDVVEAHLATCPRCRAEVMEHRETAALLAFAGHDAPAGLWDRIASNLEEAPPPVDLGLARATAAGRAGRPSEPGRPAAPATGRPAAPATGRMAAPGWRRWPLGMVAAAAVVISVLALAVALRDGGGRDGTGLPAEVASAPRVHLTSSDGRHSADVVVVDGRGYVFNDNLPALDETEVYQLWGRRGTTLVSLGLLGTDPEQEAFAVSGEFEAFAITAEDWPGVTASEQKPIVAGEVA
ncbi:MAG TPA: anti-sigma factor [Acidimicrobiales bacterium]